MKWLKKFYAKQPTDYLLDILVNSRDENIHELIHQELKGRDF